MNPSLPVRAVIGLLRAYQRYVSPLIGPRCRFHPTCSEYWIEAMRVHGLLKGLGLGAVRLLKCQPFHPGGFDYVPPRGRIRRREREG